MSSFEHNMKAARTSAHAMIIDEVAKVLYKEGFPESCVSNISVHSPDRVLGEAFTCVTLLVAVPEYPDDMYEIEVRYRCGVSSATNTLPRYYQPGVHKIANIVFALQRCVDWDAVFAKASL